MQSRQQPPRGFGPWHEVGPAVNKEYPMDIFEEETEDVNSPFYLKDEITG